MDTVTRQAADVADNAAANQAAAGKADAGPFAIEARGLVKDFDGSTAVDGVDLTVREGAIYGILGPNQFVNR